jgi:hypothetical protein
MMLLRQLLMMHGVSETSNNDRKLIRMIAQKTSLHTVAVDASDHVWRRIYLKEPIWLDLQVSPD